MNKRILVIFSLVLLISMPLTAAASVPAKDGYVQDTAHIFPEAKLSEINKIAHNYDSNISFYILTIDTLNSKNSAEYATEVFNDWGLKDNDVLMLVSKKDHRIEVNYKNPNFLANVNLPHDYDSDGNSNETNLEELIGKHFLSYAKNEDFTSGAIDFMNTFRNLIANSATNKEALKASASPAKSTEKNDSSSSIVKPLIIAGSTMAILVVLAIGGYIARRFLTDNTGTRRADREFPQNSRNQQQRPATVADALENLLNENSSTAPTTQREPRQNSNNSNNKESSPNIGYRIIRSDDESKNKDKGKVIENPEAKRIIR